MGTHFISGGRALRRWVLGGWAVGCVVLGAAGLAPHLAGLPLPAVGDAALREATTDLLGPADGSDWTVVHVLLGGCDCSRRIVATLIARPPRPGVNETVLAVSADGTVPEPRLMEAGYTVRSITPGQLRERFHLEAAPVFLVLDPAGRIRHLGGYTTHRRGSALLDREVVDALRHERTAEPLPVLGCPASAELRAAIDPIGLRTGPTAGEPSWDIE